MDIKMSSTGKNADNQRELFHLSTYAGLPTNKNEFTHQDKDEPFPCESITIKMLDFHEENKSNEEGEFSFFPVEEFSDELCPKLHPPLCNCESATASSNHNDDFTQMRHGCSPSHKRDDDCSLGKFDLSLTKQNNEKVSYGYDGDPLLLSDDFEFSVAHYQPTSASSSNHSLNLSSSPSPSPSTTNTSTTNTLPDDSKAKAMPFFYEEMWSDRYKDLVAFVNENGHANVPNNYAKNQQLARWVKRQRRLYKQLQDGKQSALPVDRMIALESVGFVWDSHESCWREKFNALLEFRRKHGHCNVPLTCKENKLGSWVKCQRRQYKLYSAGNISAMDPGRIKELEHVGFEWEIRRRGSNSKKVHIARR